MILKWKARDTVEKEHAAPSSSVRCILNDKSENSATQEI